MKRTLILITLALVAVLGLRAAKVTIVTVERNLFGFTQIVNNSPYDIHFYEAPSYGVRVVGPQRDVNYIRTFLDGGVLTVDVAPGHRFNGTAPYIELYCPQNVLTLYTGAGAGNFIAMTAMNLLNTIFAITGAGDVRLGVVNAVNLDLRSHGAGNINVTKAAVSGKRSFTQKGSGRISFNGSTPKNTQPAPQTSASTGRTTSSRTTTSRTSSTPSASRISSSGRTNGSSSSTNKTPDNTTGSTTSKNTGSTTSKNTGSTTGKNTGSTTGKNNLPSSPSSSSSTTTSTTLKTPTTSTSGSKSSAGSSGRTSTTSRGASSSSSGKSSTTTSSKSSTSGRGASSSSSSSRGSSRTSSRR